MPKWEKTLRTLLLRGVSLEGIRWVSPPGILGLGPLAAIDDVAIGPRDAEQSEVTVGSTVVRLRPGISILRRQFVFDIEVQDVHATVRQADNYSWFGFPDDTTPSARDFVPGLGADEEAEVRDDSGTHAGGGNGGGGSGGAWLPGGSSGWRPGQGHVPGHHARAPHESAQRHGTGDNAVGGGHRGAPASRQDAQRQQGARSSYASAGNHRDAFVPSRPAPRSHALHSSSRHQHTERTSSAHQGGPSRAPPPLASASAAAHPLPVPRANMPVATLAEQPSGSSQRPWCALRRVTIADGAISIYVHGAETPRELSGVAGTIMLGRDYRTMDLCVSADGHRRPESTFRCTMPERPEARNLRHCTPGAADDIPAHHFHIARDGPSPQSRAKAAAKAQASERGGGLLQQPYGGMAQAPGVHSPFAAAAPWQDQGNAFATPQPPQTASNVFAPSSAGQGRSSTHGSKAREQPARNDASHSTGVSTPPQEAPEQEKSAGVAQAKSQHVDGSQDVPERRSVSADAAALEKDSSTPKQKRAPDGGRLTVTVKGANMLMPGEYPNIDVHLRGEALSALLVERLLELPMDIYSGTIDGTFNIHLQNEAHWRQFPGFSGRLSISDASFHFWDSPDDFTGTDMSLLFDEDMMHILGGKGAYGAVRMTARGEMGLEPSRGQYNIQVRLLFSLLHVILNETLGGYNVGSTTARCACSCLFCM